MSYERLDIPAGLSADDARRLLREPRPQWNGKALRGLVFCAVGLLCVLSLPLSPRIAAGVFPGAAVAGKGLAGALGLSPQLALVLVAVALTGLFFAAVGIVDAIFGALEIHGARVRQRGMAVALTAAGLGLAALGLFFWSFYFPDTVPL